MNAILSGRQEPRLDAIAKAMDAVGYGTGGHGQGIRRGLRVNSAEGAAFPDGLLAVKAKKPMLQGRAWSGKRTPGQAAQALQKDKENWKSGLRT